MQQRLSSSIVRLAALSGVGLAFLVGGCGYKPGGSGQSLDRFCYISTPHMPQTVSLVDTSRGQTIWTCEVPVGQQLVLRFVNEGKDAPARGTDTMRWALMPIGSPRQSLDNEFVCPPSTSRRLDGTLRQGPEPYPAQYEAFMNAESSPGAYTPAAVSAGEDVTPRVPGTKLNPAPAAEPSSPSSPAVAPPSDGRFDPSKPFPRPSGKTGTTKPAPATKPAEAPAPKADPAGDPPVDLPQ